jgi:hypothetical protein
LCADANPARVREYAAAYGETHSLPVWEKPAPVPLQDNSDLPEHDVAVVVFTRVRAVDLADASHIAERAVARAILDAPAPVGADLVLRRTTQTQNLQVPVVVAQVRELGMCFGDSYLGVAPTRKAYRRHDELRERDGQPPSDIGEDA